MRPTFADAMASRIPRCLGKCDDDYDGVASYINEAQQKLIGAGGETGWWGGWYQVGFNVPRTNPYITLPPELARAVNATICRRPILIHNQWYEFLWAGVGLQAPCPSNNCGGLRDAFDRGTVSTAYDLTDSNQLIRAYISDSRDIGKRILFSNALDQNGNGIYETDDTNQVNGFHLEFTEPFVTSGFIVTSFGAVQKDETVGDVTIYQVDDTTGDEVLLARYKPWETNPSYRRYYLNGLPINCCNGGTPETVQVEVMAKLEFVPVKYPTDFLIIGNLPALKEECRSILFSESDSPSSMQQSEIHHAKAISLLRQELGHYMGKQNPAINSAIFGTAGMRKQLIGQLL